MAVSPVSVDIERMTRWLDPERVRHIVVLSGPPVAASCGLPMYRSSTGQWGAQQWQDFAGAHAIMKNPRRAWDFLEQRRIEALAARPSLSHQVIADLELFGYKVAVVTDTFDGLHRAAGSRCVHYLHGCIHRFRCTDGQVRRVRSRTPLRFGADPRIERHDLAFGEDMADLQALLRCEDAVMHACDMVLVIGAHADRHPVKGLIRMAARRRVKIVQIGSCCLSHPCDGWIEGHPDEVLGSLRVELGLMYGFDLVSSKTLLREA